MANIEPDEKEEQPLDPAMENVRRKMVRLQLVSGGIMLVMFMAVLGAIVYKITRPDRVAPPAVHTSGGLQVPADQPLAATARLPDGFKVQSSALSGNQILFFGRMPGGEARALVFDFSVGRVIADIAVSER